MKKSLYRKLLRMARDGDPEAIEAIAEMAEAVLEPDEPEINVTVVNQEPAADPVATPVAAAPAPVAAPVVAAPVATLPAAAPVPASVPAAVPAAAPIVVAPDPHEVTVDGDILAEIVSRLDRLIELMTPVSAATPAVPTDCNTPSANQDEDVVEEIVEGIAEALEAAAIVEEVLPELIPEAAEAILTESPEESVTETAMGVLSSVLDPAEGNDQAPSAAPFSRDDIRAAMSKAGPRLRSMSPMARKRAITGIVDSLRHHRPKTGHDNNVSALSSNHISHAAPEKDYSYLGAKIMASRNPHYKS